MLLCATLVGCSSGQPTSRTVWSYEKLTYNVTESGSNTTGTLVMSAEKLNADLAEYTIPTIIDGALDSVTVSLPSDSHILEGRLTFGEDYMEYKTITTSGFRPLYSYKALIIGAEQSAYTGEGDAPACLSYVLTTTYDKSVSTAVSSYIRRTTYGTEGWDGNFSPDYWVTYTKTFENIASPFCDVNQIYYSLRALNDITTDKFTYTLHSPMALELNVKNLYCASTAKVSVASSSIPYISTNYGNDYALFLTKVTVTPQDTNVIGKGIEIYFAENGLNSAEEIANGALDASGSTNTHEKVPVLIRENIGSTELPNNNGRGTITYALSEYSTARPIR